MFDLIAVMDEDLTPVTFFQIIKGTARAISGECFDALVGTPSCRSVEAILTED